MPRKSNRDQLPDWLWFFLALPISLITVLFIRNRGRLRVLPPEPPRAPRYTEPDSIPLNMEGVLPVAAEPPLVDVDAVRAVQISVDEPAAPEAPAQFDDLKIIEGIGPAIAGLLRENGIQTYQALAAAPVERLSEILAAARLGHLANPATWPEQARLAAEDQWEALDELQRTLKGGRRKG